MKIVAVVGLPGSGKSEAVRAFMKYGFHRVYFGDVTFDRMKKEGLEINEKNERIMRERLRNEYGMAAYAHLSLPKIEALLHERRDVVIESMYSMEEYLCIKEKYPGLMVVAVYASPKTRYARLGVRPERPLTPDECVSRDLSQIQNLHQAGPIALADFTAVNEGTINDLNKKLEEIVKKAR